jgi:DNA-binding response OmpR family regulator
MKKWKIFYVEDEQSLGKIVQESLESRGFEVIREEDGSRAARVFSQSEPDICVLDVMLPGKDGFTVAGEIRELNPGMPIIFLTARVQTADVLEGFSTGAIDYIRKPFSIEELIVRIQNALRDKGRGPETDAIRMGAYIFHISRQLLTNGTSARKLSFRESELLKLLYFHGDKIIERREILNLLWGNDSFFNSRNLDVYINKIRGYLKEDPSVEILTIKGVGYRFVTG